MLFTAEESLKGSSFKTNHYPSLNACRPDSIDLDSLQCCSADIHILLL